MSGMTRGEFTLSILASIIATAIIGLLRIVYKSDYFETIIQLILRKPEDWDNSGLISLKLDTSFKKAKVAEPERKKEGFARPAKAFFSESYKKAVKLSPSKEYDVDITVFASHHSRTPFLKTVLS